ncbi:AI-2E family transporter [Candidatus Pacearchaeota archaeon]|nr:AI-2E family transporter [Candidatus Pacearchaeota archaeon]
MALSNKDIRRIFVYAVLLILAIATFLIIKPIVLSIFGGLILAYIFSPLHKIVYRTTHARNISATIMCALVLIIIIVPLWFTIPLIVQQIFDLFNLSQNIDYSQIVSRIFSSSTPEFNEKITTIIIQFTGNLASTIFDYFVGLLQILPTVLLNLAVILFVFFFALRDQESLKEFVAGISPFRKDKEAVLVTRFRDITSSIIYGYIVVGVIQGLALGLGLLIFGVPKALTLTVLGIFASMLPMIGPWFIWIPITITMMVSGNVGIALAFAVYCGFFVSTIDNILRPYIVSRKAGVSSVVVLVGMIGGLFVFNIIGLILGPLILAYLILFLKAYKDGTLSDMFSPAE